MGKSDPLPGTSDISYPEVQDWVLMEDQAREVFTKYGYSEMRTPVFERTSVFLKTIGDETDVVQKEMYTFEDRGGRSLTLRPEGTAGTMRAVANVGIGQGEDRRVFYMGPMFRGERPAAGRKRQFHQIGVENVGKISPVIDAENIAMMVDYLNAIGITGYKVLVNSRGTKEDRKPAEAVLRQHFSSHVQGMCEDCQRRFNTNIWRMMDCKQPGCQQPIDNAPDTFDLLGEESCGYFKQVCDMLDALRVEYTVDHRLVRGLDYYEHTVFEVTHENLGAQDAIAGGGRYKIQVPGIKNPVEGVGFAAGMERLLMVRDSLGLNASGEGQTDLYLISLGDKSLTRNFQLAAELRAAGFHVQMDYEQRSMKAQMRSANKSNARAALILGESELEAGSIQCKDLQQSEQVSLSLDTVADELKKIIG